MSPNSTENLGLLLLNTNRRRLLQGSAAAIIGSFFTPGSTVTAADPIGLSLGKKLILRSEKPINGEPELGNLANHWITPIESFYVRNHGEIPQLDLNQFAISIEGAVERPQSILPCDLLDRFPNGDQTATLTCAGNRRSEFTGPKISGVAWGAGAIGNARWSGISLRDLLKFCGIRPEAKHVWFEGADMIVDKQERYPFGGSITIEKAMEWDALSGGAMLATHMNDKPLLAEHGAPIRAVIPGLIGARSVKWLRKIIVSDRPSPNHYQAHAYKLIQSDTAAEVESASALQEFTINSMICLVQFVSGKLTARGIALPNGVTGRSLKQVEVSVDGGATWAMAKLTSPQRSFCWSIWSAELPLETKPARLTVRATDSAGDTQPKQMKWNLKGYQFNAWHSREV